jgi:hypothetical protein
MRPRLRPALRMLAASALTLALALGPTAQAQDEPLGSFCALLTADEASTALGVEVTPTEGTDLDCTYGTDVESSIYLNLFTRAEGGTLEFIKIGWPDGESLAIGGKPAWYVEDVLWTEIGGRLLTLQLVSFGADGPDHKTALTSLATIAVGRWDSLSIPEATPEPTAEPQPSFVGDQELVDLFPDEIAGEAVSVTSFNGQELLALATNPEDQATFQEITNALAPLGKSIDDVSFGLASVTNGSGGSAVLAAFRVRGADATGLVPLILPLYKSSFLSSFANPQETTTQVAGRDVIMVTDGPPSDTGQKAYVYARNDVVWLAVVVGTGIAIEDVLGLLP